MGHPVVFLTHVFWCTLQVSFRSASTYLGLTQMKVYYAVDVRFRFRTLESDGLLMFNDGVGKDFLALELVGGHVTLVLNTGCGAEVLRDASPVVLNDDQWHEVCSLLTF